MDDELRNWIGLMLLLAVVGCGTKETPPISKVVQQPDNSESSSPVDVLEHAESDKPEPDTPDVSEGDASPSVDAENELSADDETQEPTSASIDFQPSPDTLGSPGSDVPAIEPEVLPPAFRLMLPTTAGLLLVDVEIRLGDQSLAEAFTERIDEVINEATGDDEANRTWEDLFTHVSGDTQQFGRQMGMNSGQYRQMIQLYDSNRNNRPDHDEVARYLFRNSGVHVPFRLFGTDYYREVNLKDSSLFKALDADNDQRLQPDELDQAGESLLKFDPNADQRIDPGEVMVTTPTPNRPNSDPAWDRRRSNRRGEVAMDLEGYVDWSMLSYSLDGYRGRRPFSLTENPIDAIDADDDSSVSTHEAQALNDCPADIRILIDLAAEPTIEVVKKQSESMQTNTTAKSHVTLSDDTFCLFAQVIDRAQQRNRIPPEVFQMLDANNDGGLDEDEIPDGAPTEISFEDLDADDDGKLTFEEINSAGKNQKQPIWSVQVRARGAEFPDAVFSWLDANHDHFLSTREILTAGERLRMCRVDDQPIKATDIPDTFALQFLRGDSAQDQQNFVFAQPIAIPTTNWPQWALNMDTNRDGEISALEFPGSLMQFSDLDTNGDQFVSADEIAK